MVTNYQSTLLSFYNFIYHCKLNDKQVYALGKFMNIENRHIYELLTGKFVQEKIKF